MNNLPEETNIGGGTGAGEEESRQRTKGGQELEARPPQDQQGPGYRLTPEGGRSG